MITPNEVLVAGAGSATLATAVSNYNTAIAAAVSTAQGVANVINDQITISPGNIIFDGTLYIASGSVLYKTT